MSAAQSMTATALPEHRSPVDPGVTVVNASNADLRAELDYRNVGTPQAAKAALLARAEWYESRAATFGELAAFWHRHFADEMRKVAESL